MVRSIILHLLGKNEQILFIHFFVMIIPCIRYQLSILNHYTCLLNMLSFTFLIDNRISQLQLLCSIFFGSTGYFL